MRIWIFILAILTFSCRSTEYPLTVQKKLLSGQKDCARLVTQLVGEDDFKKYITHLNSHPYGDPSTFTKRGFDFDAHPPVYYYHNFKLSYERYINFEFTVISDSTSVCSDEDNKKFRGYQDLMKYNTLLDDSSNLNKLIDIGINYFEDDRFRISFSTTRNKAGRSAKEFPTEGLLNLKKNKSVYELIDRDSVYDAQMQYYVYCVIVVDPNTMKIIAETLLLHQIVY